MLLTNQQKFLLDILKRLVCVRESQLVSLIRPVFCRQRPDIAPALLASSMRQLILTGGGGQTLRPFQISNFSPSGWKTENTAFSPWTVHRRIFAMPINHLFDKNAPFPEETADNPELAMTESPAPDMETLPPFPETDALEDGGAENEPEIPYGEESGEAEPAEPEMREENAVIRRPRAGRNAPRERSGAASDRAAFFGLDFNGLDRSLTPEQRKEWNSIYASYCGRSVMSGKIVGVDRAQVQARNPRTGILETRRIFCAVVIPFRVRIIIPEMEMWVQGEERPGFVLRNTPGASVDFVIIRVDRENNLAVASRRAALSSRRYYFSTQPSMNRTGSRIQCGVMAVGPRRCPVNCNGYDEVLQ